MSDEENLGTAQPAGDTEDAAGMINESIPDADDAPEITESFENEHEPDTGAAPENEAVPGAAAPTVTEKPSKRRKKYHAPLYIALITLLFGIMFFCGWQCFFNTNIDGTWGFTIKGEKSSDDIVCNLSFDDTQVRFQSSGTVYLGRLMIEDENGNALRDDKGDPVLSIIMNVNNQPSVFKFNYEFEGNMFTGRKLMLTDLSGMFPTEDSDKKNTKDYVKLDGKEYRIWTLTPSSEDIKITVPKDFKADDKLVGSWLYKSEESAEAFTWTFEKDGYFEHITYGIEVHGSYTVKDGVISIKFIQFGNSKNEIVVKYKLSGDKLTIYQENDGVKLMEQELKKVSDKNAFKSEIK